MYTFLITLIIIASILLVGLVLIQNSKGGGLAAGFTSGNQVMGAPKTADFLEKATWTLVAVIGLLSIIAVGISISERENAPREDESAIIQQVEEAAAAQDAATATPDFNEPAEE